MRHLVKNLEFQDSETKVLNYTWGSSECGALGTCMGCIPMKSSIQAIPIPLSCSSKPLEQEMGKGNPYGANTFQMVLD